MREQCSGSSDDARANSVWRPQVDAVIEKARIERDDQARRSLIFDLQRHLAKTAYGFLTLGVAAGFLMAWPNLKNFAFTVARANYRLWVDAA